MLAGAVVLTTPQQEERLSRRHTTAHARTFLIARATKAAGQQDFDRVVHFVAA
jgi:hypothetical protein